MADSLRSLWAYRYFVANSIWNDFYLRFARSRLGGAWLVLQPLSQVLIYAFILSNLLSAKIPGIDNPYGYAIYLMSGLLGWNLFSDIIDRCTKVFVANSNSIKKVNFPKIALPVIAIGTAILNNLVLFIVMTIIFITIGHFPTEKILLIPLFMLVIVIFATGIGIILGIINVFIRDIDQITPIALQLLFWFTPIVYPISIIPEKYAAFLKLNPLYHVVEFYHQIIAYDTIPSANMVIAITISGVLLILISFILFRRAGADMADVL